MCVCHEMKYFSMQYTFYLCSMQFPFFSMQYTITFFSMQCAVYFPIVDLCSMQFTSQCKNNASLETTIDKQELQIHIEMRILQNIEMTKLQKAYIQMKVPL